MGDIEHVHITYNDVHNSIKRTAAKIQAEFKPQALVAIGGGGFFPARVLRTFLKDKPTDKNVPMHAIGLSLYEPLEGTQAEQIGAEVIRTQWLGPDSLKSLLGKRVLIVDEVDDSRKTLQYALQELEKDLTSALEALPESLRQAQRTKFAIFVVHNKRKAKIGTLPSDLPYYAGEEPEDVWLVYPWEATDIEEHDLLAAEDKARANSKAGA